MEERRTERPDHDRASTEHPTEHPTERRATVGEAAGYLGITAEAVRSRIKRGTLKSMKEGASVYVLLERPAERLTGQSTKKADDWTGPESKNDRTTTEQGRTGARTPPEPDPTNDRAELVDSLQDQVEYLRDQLGEEREARRRADMLLARLAEANASMAGQIREITAPDQGLQEPESVVEASGGAEPRSDTVGLQTSAQEPSETARRPWWLRWLGG